MQEARQVVGGKFPGFNRESFPLFAGPEAGRGPERVSEAMPQVFQGCFTTRCFAQGLSLAGPGTPIFAGSGTCLR